MTTTANCGAGPPVDDAVDGPVDGDGSTPPLVIPTGLVIPTDHGSIQGKSSSGVRAFLGIPLGASTAGDYRWKPPQPAASWSAAREANTGSFGGDKNNVTLFGESGGGNSVELRLMSVQAYWTRFATQGDPDGGEDPTWPSYDTTGDLRLQLEVGIDVVSGWKGSSATLWITCRSSLHERGATYGGKKDFS